MKFKNKIKIRVNGKKVIFNNNTSIESLIEKLKIPLNKVAIELNKKIINKSSVTMIHGKKDEVVPVNYSKKVLKIFKNSSKKLLIIKNGDHSLFNKIYKKRILKELKTILKQVF